MLKKVLKVSIVFVTLFYFYMDSVFAYEFSNSNNEKKVNSMISDIHESKQLYNELMGIDDGMLNFMSSDMMWWPIGSDETVTIGGKLFAPYEPNTVHLGNVFACYTWRAKEGEICGWHYGVDIFNPSIGAPGVLNIIAVKDGTVIYPTSDYQTQYKDHTGSEYGNGDGGGLGNYVIIEHSDGIYSVYGHMAQNSITVRAGETVRQGQVIGKMGHTGSSTGTHLHFAIRIGGAYINSVDPLEYIDPENPRPQGTNSSFSPAGTTLSRSEFVAKMNDYCERSKNKGFCNNFASRAESIYDVSVRNGVNPELVVVMAGAESSWTLDEKCAYTNNYWGIRIKNGEPCNTGGVYDSLEEGIVDFAGVIAEYNPGGYYADYITNMNSERTKAGCDPAGHGLPGTIEGLQSAYSWIGPYRYNPGNSNLGGCYYFNVIYGKDYCNTKPTCTDYNNCPAASKTTVCEENDYTAWRLQKQEAIRYNIFGL